MKMERTAEIVRGWPYDGAMDLAETIKAASTLVNGDWVEKQSDGTVALTSATGTNQAGLVITGNGDSGSRQTATKLWFSGAISLLEFRTTPLVLGLPTCL